MHKILQILKKTLKKLQYRLTTSELPQGQDAFYSFFNDLAEVYDLPNNDSFKRMVATMIQHMPPNIYRIKKYTLYVSIKRAIANEVAFYVLKELNDKIKEAKSSADSTNPKAVV